MIEPVRNHRAAGIWLALFPFVASCTTAPRRAEPQLVTYLGSACHARDLMPRFETFMGRKPDGIMTGMEHGSWKAMRASFAYGQRCWADQPYRAIVWVPMLVNGNTLAQGAAGDFDEQFRWIAQMLMKNKRGDSYLRIGHEFNGDWYNWAAYRDPENWTKYFRRIARIFRATKGADFKIVWNPGLGRLRIAPDRVYPGDDVVDVIGADFYNRKANANDTDPEKRWQRYLNQPYGLNWLSDFAAKHHKPLAIPEWGTGTTPDGMGPGDDPVFIRHMASWIFSNNVLFHGYWDFEDKAYNSALSTGQYAESGKAFRESFGTPAMAPNLSSQRSSAKSHHSWNPLHQSPKH